VIDQADRQSNVGVDRSGARGRGETRWLDQCPVERAPHEHRFLRAAVRHDLRTPAAGQRGSRAQCGRDVGREIASHRAGQADDPANSGREHALDDQLRERRAEWAQIALPRSDRAANGVGAAQRRVDVLEALRVAAKHRETRRQREGCVGLRAHERSHLPAALQGEGDERLPRFTGGAEYSELHPPSSRRHPCRAGPAAHPSTGARDVSPLPVSGTS